MDNGVNVKGASFWDLFKAYIESGGSEQEKTQSKTGEAFAKIWKRLDKEGNSLIDGGTQVKKRKGKKLLDENFRSKRSISRTNRKSIK